MNPSTPGLPVHHQLPESTQTHVYWVCDAIQPSHPLSSPSPPALNLSQHQGLFKQLYNQVPKYIHHPKFHGQRRLVALQFIGSQRAGHNWVHTLPKKKPASRPALSHFLPPRTLATNNLFVSMKVPILDIWCKWNHTVIWDLLYLFFFFHLACFQGLSKLWHESVFYSFVWLKSILLSDSYCFNNL